MQTTYRAKTLLTKENLSNIDKFCNLFNKIERKLFHDWIVLKKDLNELKSSYQVIETGAGARPAAGVAGAEALAFLGAVLAFFGAVAVVLLAGLAAAFFFSFVVNAVMSYSVFIIVGIK